MKLKVTSEDLIEVFKYLNSSYSKLELNEDSEWFRLYNNCVNVYSSCEKDIPKAIYNKNDNFVKNNLFSNYYYEEFKKIMELNDFKCDNLDNYINDVEVNYHNVYGKKCDFEEINNDFSYYNSDNNLLFIPLNVNYDSVVFRELLHMNSTYDSTNNKKMSGLSYWEHDNLKVGYSLNEGYTNLLAIRYFTDEYYFVSRFKLELEVAYILEDIVGKEYMEACYMSSDINAFVNELSKYQPKSNVINFVKQLDLLNDYTNNCKSDYYLELINDLLRENILYFLLNVYNNKYSIKGDEEFLKEYYDIIFFTNVYNFYGDSNEKFIYERIKKANSDEESIVKNGEKVKFLEKKRYKK